MSRLENAARLMENAALELKLEIAEHRERPDADRLLQMAEHAITAAACLWKAHQRAEQIGELVK